MILIAHRGLTNGPDKDLENDPTQIEESLDLGFDCEIDFWYHNNLLWLGHDGPVYNISEEFIQRKGLWIHAKNIEALDYLSNHKNLNYFWHQEDDYTLTSQGYIWTYPGKRLGENSIMVLPEWHHVIDDLPMENCKGICSDYIEKYRI